MCLLNVSNCKVGFEMSFTCRLSLWIWRNANTFEAVDLFSCSKPLNSCLYSSRFSLYAIILFLLFGWFSLFFGLVCCSPLWHKEETEFKRCVLFGIQFWNCFSSVFHFWTSTPSWTTFGYLHFGFNIWTAQLSCLYFPFKF